MEGGRFFFLVINYGHLKNFHIKKIERIGFFHFLEGYLKKIIFLEEKKFVFFS